MIRLPFEILGWIGRRGTVAVAISVLVGMALPAWSAYARPWLTYAVFLLLVLAFLRVDQDAVRLRLRKPGKILAASVWMLLCLPVLAVILFRTTGLNEFGAEVMLAVFIVTAAPSVMSAPAFIYLMGLDGALSLTVMIAGVLLTPITAPLVGALILEGAVPLDPLDLGVMLLLLLGGAYVIARLVRWLAGSGRVSLYKSQIDGLNVLVLFFFAVAAMDNVAATFVDRPLFTILIAALAFVVALTQIGLTLLVFAPTSRADAFVIAHSAGNRNMGLMVAALGGTVPEFTWLYFALGQLPIYMLPLFLKPFARWFSRD
jgi:predicted Na+-dependent transporter